MTQRQIDAAYRRSLKTVYKHLSPEQKQLVKAMEQIEQNDKELRILGRSLIFRYGQDWRRVEESKASKDYELFMALCLDNIKQSEKVSRLEEKYSLDREEVMSYHHRMNQAHSASMVGAVSL